MQRPQLQDKLNISYTNEIRIRCCLSSTKHRIWPKCLAHTRKLRQLQTTIFSGGLSAIRIFSAAFRLTLKIFGLAAKFGGFGV